MIECNDTFQKTTSGVFKLHQLLYLSNAVKLLSESELKDILSIARHNNSLLEVTGMLVYQDGSFIQVLEGDKAHIELLFEKISKDARHNNIIVIGEQEVNQRSFANWDMAFHKLSETDLNKYPALNTLLEKNSPGKQCTLTDIVNVFVTLTTQ